MINKKSIRKGKKAKPRLHLSRQQALYSATLGMLIVATVAIAIWGSVQAYRAKVTTEVVNTEYEGIQMEYATHQGEGFYGHVAYPVTSHSAINKDVRIAVDAQFTPCKDAALQRKDDAARECNVSFDIYFATPTLIQLEATFTEASNGTQQRHEKLGLLYSRETGKRLGITDIFRSDHEFLDELAKASRGALETHFAKAHDKSIKEYIAENTKPQAENFNNFVLTQKEQLFIIFNDTPAQDEPVRAEMPVDTLYNAIAAIVVDATLPKLKEQKEEERKRIEEEKRLAAEAEAARQRTRQLVAPNRSNIDCAVMKCIALTYDDGPAAYTNQMIDILHSRGAVATFFVLGVQVERYAATLKRAVELQNEVANHSWDHAHFTALDNGTIQWQIDQTSQAIFNATGAYPKLFRPPGGAYDDRVVNQIHMPVAMWSADTYDWRDRSSELVYQRAIGGARPGGTILMHDIHAPTIQATPRIIDELQRQGYVLVTMSELFGITKDNIAQWSNRVLRGR